MTLNHQTIQVSSAKSEAVELALGGLNDLVRIWGSAALGLTLTNAFFKGEHLTTDDLARSLQVSTETVRRWLRPLINIDRVRVVKEGRSVTYKAREEWANKTAETLVAMHNEFQHRRQNTASLRVVASR